MSALVNDPSRVIVTLGSVELGELGALVIAMRHMLEGGVPLGDHDAGALYILASMAERTWQRLDGAVQPIPQRWKGEIDVDG